jgi:bacillithiol biosynthesis cysteine-adding enzyme BshC
MGCRCYHPRVSTNFTASWLAGEARALALLPDRFRHPTARLDAVNQAGRRPMRPDVWEVLRAQNQPFMTPQRQRSVDALQTPGTTAVITGQQVGLFLGPLYTLHKAASAVAVARALERESGHPCVPVFWLQTEDHDLAEISTCVLPNGTDPALHVTVPVPADNRIPVAHVPLGASVLAALKAASHSVQSLPHAREHVELLTRAYQPGRTWWEAFATVLMDLFADHGLLVLNPRDPRLAPHAAPVHARALREAAPVTHHLIERAHALEAAGFAGQVHVRAGSPLSFYSPQGVNGPRYRLESARETGRWSLVQGGAQTFSNQELLAHLEREPLCFSTSALLRPLLQDHWFPTAAYVGGPAEMAYFAQLQPLYAAWEVPMPMALPRARFRIWNARTQAALRTLNMTADQACLPQDKLAALLVERQAARGFEPPAQLEARLLGAATSLLPEVLQQLTRVDATLAKQVTRTRETITKSVGRLAGRYARALAQQNQVDVERLERIRAWALPDGVPQERVFGVPHMAALWGGRALANRLVEAVDPFSGALQELWP